MSFFALALVIVAALAHASWNLLSKQPSQADSVVCLWLVAALSSVLWAPVVIGYLVLSGDRPGWPVLGVVCCSALLHLGYFLLLQRGYREGDLSVVYPVARGTGPMLASAVAVFAFGEHPGVAGVTGIALIGVGVFMMSGGGGRADVRGIAFGLATGLFIAAYTVWDARVVGFFAISPILLNYGADLARTVMITPMLLRKRALIAPVWREHRYRVLGAALLTPLSYLLVLYAFTMAPVSVVAPMREMSVLIAVVLGGRLLAEGDLRRRLLAAGVILGGVVTIAFS